MSHYIIYSLFAVQLFFLLALGLILLKSLKGNKLEESLKKDLAEIKERQITLKALLEGGPDLVQSKLKVNLSEQTTTMQGDFSKLRESLIEKMGQFRQELSKNTHEEFESLRKVIQDQLEKISTKVRENLDEGFKKTNQTFQSVIERLAKIDEAQKKIDALSQNVVSLQDILTDKKSRGIFGEVHLKQVLSSVFGEQNHKVYQLQHGLKNGKIVDAALFLPEPIGLLSVDSKFPLENYKRMMERELSDLEREAARKEFVKNMKKHIDDISSKYIIPQETADQAILFLPAEAIFAEIHAYHPDLVDYANGKRVWITSPTTFLATLTTIQVILLNLERNKYMSVIHEEINKLGVEFGRYRSRWDSLAKNIDNVSKNVHEIHITSNKITDRFQKIQEVEIEGKNPPSNLPTPDLETLTPPN